MHKVFSQGCSLVLFAVSFYSVAAAAQTPPAQTPQQRPATAAPAPSQPKNTPRAAPVAQTSQGQAPAAQPEQQPVSSVPQNTTASFGDWVMRCRRIDNATNAAGKSCEVAQTLQVQGQGPIAEIAFGKAPGSDKMLVVVVLPNNVVFADQVSLSTDEKDKGVELGYRRCLPSGCYADAELKDDALAKWKSQTGAGRLRYKDGSNRDLALPFSFRGLAQAIDAMAKP